MLNRNGDTVSAQISEMGPITFQPGKPFNLKNDGAAVILEVNLWGMAEDEWVTTCFETGWNPEIIRSIKPTAAQNLLWGL